MAVSQAEVIVRDGSHHESRYVLEPGVYLLGGDSACQIRLHDSDLDGPKAQLTFDGATVTIEDLGSRTVTLADGSRPSGTVSLPSSQKIQIGGATVEVNLLQQIAAELAEEEGGADLPTAQVNESNETGTNSPHYEVDSEIAQGGMGVVWRVTDLRIERPVAMKVVRADRLATPENRQRFLQEAKLTGQLEHPNIVPVHELDVDENGQPFYTMKLVRGVTLHDVLVKIKAGHGPTIAQYPLAQLLTIYQKVCDALAFAHSKGVIHRDLKPENIMIGEYGEVLVMDWGLAKQLADRDSKMEDRKSPSSINHLPSAPLTMAGRVMGTPQFMAPEQAEGRAVDERTDVFALGGILYSILTLAPPVDGATVEEVMAKVRSGAITPPIQFGTGVSPVSLPKKLGRDARSTFPHLPNGRVPESLSAVAMKALALRPEDRYQSVPELQREITAYQTGFATTAERAGLGKLLALAIKRHKKEAVLLAVGFVVLSTVAITAMVRIIASERKATAALADLKSTAPEFREDALSLIREHKFTEALSRMAFAISLAPNLAEYHYLKGNILESLLRFDEAVAAYREALRLDPTLALANENLALCQKILHDNAGQKEIQPFSLTELWTATMHQGRLDEARAFMHRLGKDQQLSLATCRAILDKAGVAGKLTRDENGILSLDLTDAPIVDLAPLRNMPLTTLILDNTQVTDLRPLAGMPLHRLKANHTQVSDIRPLQGMPLQELNLQTTQVRDLAPLTGLALLRQLRLSHSPVSDLAPLKGLAIEVLDIDGGLVTDLSPLRGMPLKWMRIDGTSIRDLGPLKGSPLVQLHLGGTKVVELSPLMGMHLEVLSCFATAVRDLSPLAGMPLQQLTLNDTEVTDLSPLRGMPLTEICLSRTKVNDLSPLKGMPLKGIMLEGCVTVRDLTPLAECRRLEYIILPPDWKDVEFLRAFPYLRNISIAWVPDGSKQTPAKKFWQDYDARHGLDDQAAKLWEQIQQSTAQQQWDHARRDFDSLIGQYGQTRFVVVTKRDELDQIVSQLGAHFPGWRRFMPLDITTAFNADVIATESHVAANEFGPKGGAWMTTGLSRKRGETVEGLPDDGVVAIPHRMSRGYFQVKVGTPKNVILISGPQGSQPKPASVELLPALQRAYSEIAVLHSTAHGDGTMVLTVQYTAGTSSTHKLQLLDWCASSRTHALADNEAFAVSTSRTVDAMKPEMISEIVPLDPKRVVKSLTFAFESITPGRLQTDPDQPANFVAGIFAVSAQPAEAK